MLIRPSKHVDLSGKIFHPYLAYWHSRVETSTLAELLSLLQGIFSQDPPVYTKPSSGSSPVSPPSQRNTPFPLGGSGGSGTVSSPLKPSFPSASFPPSSLPGSFPPDKREKSPARSVDQVDRKEVPPVYQAKESPVDSLRIKLKELLQQKIKASQDKLAQEMASDVRYNKQLNEQELKLDDVVKKLEVEIEKTKGAISGTRQKMKDMQTWLEQAQGQADEIDPDDLLLPTGPLYNQYIFAKTRKLTDRLFELVAEDQAIDDAIYNLGVALNRDVVDLSTFLKHVRLLAREQFLKRALIKKCRQRALLS